MHQIGCGNLVGGRTSGVGADDVESARDRRERTVQTPDREFVGLGEMQDDIAHGPAVAPRRRLPVAVIQAGQDCRQFSLLFDQCHDRRIDVRSVLGRAHDVDPPARRPRTTRPGPAPVSLSWSPTRSPATIVATYPAERWRMRPASVGRSFRNSGGWMRSRSRSRTLTSTRLPSKRATVSETEKLRVVS